jgi:hypothetical protein
MLAWYEDVKNLTEKKGEERDAFVRRHVRSASRGSARSISSDGALDEDEADQIPYASQSISSEAAKEEPKQRPSPGGRFPSDIQLERNLQAPPPSSGSSEIGHDLTTASGGLQDYTPYPTHTTDHDSAMPHQQHYDQGYPTSPNDAAYHYNTEHAYPPVQQRQYDHPDQAQSAQYANPASGYSQPVSSPAHASTSYQPTVPQQPIPSQPILDADLPPIERHNSAYGEWMTPVAGGAAAGGLAAAAYSQHQQHQEPQVQQQPFVDPSSSVISNAESLSTSNATEMPASPVPGNPGQEIQAPQPIPLVEKSFLGSDEAVPAAASSNVLNGGPVLRETGHGFPPMMRHSTDISISDLHVPGEYPRIPKSDV